MGLKKFKEDFKKFFNRMTSFPIYVLTTIDLKTEDEYDKFDVIKKHRAVAWSFKLDFLIEDVKNNACDINEAGHYPYAVIEEMYEGFYPTIVSEHWFKFDRETEKYIEIERPKSLNCIQISAIG
jgi:hypothetical protein